MVLVQDVSPILLQLPIIVSLVAVLRYVVGLKTWKNYPTLALSLAFYLLFISLENVLLATLYWTLLIASIIGSAIAARHLIRKLKINYYARVSVMYLAATVVTLLFLTLTTQVSSTPAVAYPTFGIAAFLIGTTIDELATLLFKKDMQEFIRRFISTIGISLVSGLLLTWEWWNSFLGRHQEVLAGVLVIDFVVAFWTVIRLTELVRFGSIVKNQK
jgi:hypothetical protein